MLIIKKYLEGGNIDSSEERVLKMQLFDSLKMVAIGIPFILIPGASVLLPILMNLAEKHHINILPPVFDNNAAT